MSVVGIDPGTHRVGYAFLQGDRRTPRLVVAETIAITRGRSASERLAELEQELTERLKRDRPSAVAIEKLFFTKNTKTAIAVAEARGIMLLTAARHVPSIWEYTPSEVKLAVTGYGRADKLQVHRMIRALFPKEELPLGDDAIDAIAIALTAIYQAPPMS